MLENNGTHYARIGSSNYSRSGKYYVELLEIQSELKIILENDNIYDMVYEMNYSDILGKLVHGHR